MGYREYRKNFNATKGLVTPLRWLRDVLLRTWERIRRKTPYKNARRIAPQVAFVGLWDTVDAYGLPIDEMTRGWDKWVWPLSMCERDAPPDIAKVCHAIALDDERHTFHPVLLDERDTKPAAHTDEERVTQVWFSGVHSNVGGGYPDDSLAHVSLLWMADEAVKKGLKFHAHVRNLWVARADPNGPIYDPRRGVGAYYRYNPRSIFKLTRDEFADVRIPRPKIHESVFRRIQSERDDYAPIVLPQTYDVVTAAPKHADTVTPQGDLLREEQNPYEHPTQAAARAARQEKVWNLVWVRRVLYFSTVFVTAALLLGPVLFKGEMLPEVNFGLGAVHVDLKSGTVWGLLELAGGFLPETAQPLVTFWQAHEVIFAVLASVLTALLVSSTVVQRAIGYRMKGLWDGTVMAKPREVAPATLPNDPIFKLRWHPAYRGTAEFLSQKAFPFVFGLVALSAVALIILGTINRGLFTVRTVAGRTCTPAPLKDPLPGDIAAWPPIQFNNKELCQAAGINLQAGHTYEVSITLPKGWTDKGIPSDLTGISTSAAPWAYIPALPFRRVLRASWFVPVARIGVWTPEYHMLTQSVTEITPRQTGQLFLFVNDTVGPPGFRSFFYENNEPGLADPATVIVKEKVLTPASTSQ